MSQSSIIAASLIIAYVVFITVRGELPAYLAVMTGGGRQDLGGTTTVGASGNYFTTGAGSRGGIGGTGINVGIGIGSGGPTIGVSGGGIGVGIGI